MPENCFVNNMNTDNSNFQFAFSGALCNEFVIYRYFRSRERKFGSSNRQFAITKVCYVDRIYKTFVRVKRREMEFGL